MTIRTEIQAKIAAITAKAIADKQAITTKAIADIAVLQAYLDSNSVWLDTGTEIFRKKVETLINLLRQQP